MPDRKIVFDNAFEDNPPKKMIMTVTFEEKDGKTPLTLHTLFMSPAMKDEYVGMGIEEGRQFRSRPAHRCRGRAEGCGIVAFLLMI